MSVVTVLRFVSHTLSPSTESLASGWHSEPTEALIPLLHNHTKVPSNRLIPQSGFKFAFDSI